MLNASHNMFDAMANMLNNFKDSLFFLLRCFKNFLLNIFSESLLKLAIINERYLIKDVINLIL